jgi:dimethylsulfide dehydrogenase subunit gamma/complex iron-sulfur molybdoenzyme family reductase subunit gamma
MRHLVAASLLLAGGMATDAAWAQGAPVEQRTIRVLSVKAADAASPHAAIWKKAPTTLVALQPAFPAHASIVGTPVTERLTVQAVRTGDRLFVRLAWADRAANSTIKDTTAFVDGAAVQFPINGKDSTPPTMGDADNPVNVWYWRADGRTENVVAHGFGSATRVPTDALKGAAEHSGNGWAVVLARSLRVKPEEGVTLSAKGTMPVAFAAWDGANQERDGLKAVTLDWWKLQF